MFLAVSAPELLAVGEAFDDLIFVGLDRLPRPGEELKTSTFVQTIGGGVVITSVAASRLGLDVEIISALSEPAATRLKKEHVKVVNVRRGREPHAITASLSTPGNRAFVTFNGINDELEDRLLERMQHARARHVHFALFPHDCRRWEPVVESLRARRITTSWDFGWNEPLLNDRRFPYLVNALDYVFFNEQEAVLYARRLHLDAALALWRTHPHNVILKLGSRGSTWIASGRELHAAAPRVKVLDTTGAGDAFNGGFLVALLRGLPARICLQLGNFIGAMSTRVAGGLDALPSLGEIPEVCRPGRGSAPAPERPRQS